MTSYSPVRSPGRATGIDAVWASLRWPGLEHAVLAEAPAGPRLDSQAVYVLDGVPARVAWRIACDLQFQTRRLVLQVRTAGGVARLELRGDGAGGWCDGQGIPVPDIDGCIDVDVSVTPATNTLPVRRLCLAEGEHSDLTVAYVSVPQLGLAAVSQRYICLSRSDDHAVYRYRSGTFEAELLLDNHGLVVDYPGVWQRVPTERFDRNGR